MVLIALSTDTADDLRSWAADAEFPFLFASDPGSAVGRAYGAYRDLGNGRFTNDRTLFVIGPDGRIAWRAVPFRELDPTAYEELREALDAILPAREED